MAVIGNIIKATLEITGRFWPEPAPGEAQKQLLRSMLQTAASTSFGKKYHFSDILQKPDLIRQFTASVPYHDYNAMYQKWWRRQIEHGETDVSWPGNARYFALSAGTTGKESKRIPVTEDMLEAIRKTSLLQILATSNFKLPSYFYEKEIMMLGSSTQLQKSGKHLEGEISGITARNIPAWFERFYRPGKEIASISDWDKRVERIAIEAPGWDIGAMAGIPSWNELMLKKVIEYNGANHIHDIWPNLRVFASGGVAFSPYRKSFDKLMGRPMTYLDTYLASEGFIAYQARPNRRMAMKLSFNSGIFFEFIPFKEEYLDNNGSIEQGAPSLTIDEVEEGHDYVLVISTVAGVWRYMIGDTVRFTDKQLTEIIITGRTKHFLNVVGSQLSVLQMNTAMKKLEELFGLRIPEFTVSAVRQTDDYIHHWYLGSAEKASKDELASALDEILQDMNKAYKMARGKALKGVKVDIVSPAVFHGWAEKNKSKGGQVKIPRVMSEKKFTQWRSFADTFKTEA